MADSQDRSSALAPDRVLDIAARALSRDGEQAQLKNAYEAVALIGHACMIAVDFRLVGLGEDQKPDDSESPVLPKEWNANTTYSFRYAHTQSSMEFLLKVNRLGNNAVVFALALGHDKTTSFDIAVKDYVSESSLPLSTSTEVASALRDVFISTARLNDLIGLFKVNVIQRLAPGLQKEGYEDTGEQVREREPGQAPQPQREPLRDDRLPEPARPYPFNDPLAEAPRRPVADFPPPGFEDEYEINRPPRGWPPGNGGRNPLSIGERDLYPPGLAPHDPLRGTFGPGGGGGGGGMHPTFDDPLFGGRRREDYDPQVPPGSRYDPVGPGDRHPFGQGGPFPGGRGRGSGGFGGFGGDII